MQFWLRRKNFNLLRRQIWGRQAPRRLASAFFLLSLQYSHLAVAEVQTLVLNDVNQTPLTTEAGDGFFDIIAGEAFRRAGLRLQLIRLPPERGLRQANAGMIDGELTRTAGMENTYPNLVRVPEKIMDWHFVAFTRDTALQNINWAKLDSLSVGHIRGWKIYEQHLKQHPQVTVAETAEQLFTILDKNRIDVALYTRALGLPLIEKMGIKNIRAIEPSLAEREMYIYLNQRHADKIPALAAALREIKREGLYTRVCHEHLIPSKATTRQCRAN